MSTRAASFGPLLALLAAANALHGGCGGDEESPCRLVGLPESGGVSLGDPLAEPLFVPEIRRAMCVRGVVPCNGERTELRSFDPEVVLTLTDAEVPWVFYVVGATPGRAAVRLLCGVDAVDFDVEVR